MKGWMYILLCSNNNYYIGSTNNIEKRLEQHQNGEGANYTKKNLPVQLVYYEEFNRIDEAFYREKQVQGWSRKKKEALIAGEHHKLNSLAECKNETNFKRTDASILRQRSVTELGGCAQQPVSVVERSRNAETPKL